MLSGVCGMENECYGIDGASINLFPYNLTTRFFVQASASLDSGK